MKIGIDARMFRSATAGIGRYSQNLIKNLLKIDQENHYVLFMTAADEREARDQLPATGNYKIVITNIPHYSLTEQTKMTRIVAKEKCDLVHFLNFNYPVKYDGRFIVTIHDLTLLFYPEAARKTNFAKQWAFRYILKKACENSSKIIAPSESTKKDVLKTFNIPAAKIQVIHEAADDKKLIEVNKNSIDKIRKQYGLTANPIILYVGQFRRHKNIKRLLETFGILKKEMSAELVLIGKVPQGFKIDNKALLRDTLMPGFVSDAELAAWYKLASVFVFPSLYEGFGLPGLEAMTAGVPVVSSKRASLPEIYQDAALYFDPLKPQEIADKIKIVLTNKEKKDWLIRQGKLTAKIYSWRKTAAQTLKIYQELREE